MRLKLLLFVSFFGAFVKLNAQVDLGYKEVKLGAFIEIEVLDNVNVLLKQQKGTPKAEVRGPNKYWDEISFEIKDSTLYIKQKNEDFFNRNIVVSIYVEDLEGVYTNDNATLANRTPFKADYILMMVSDNSNVDLKLEVDTLECYGTGQVDVLLEGKATYYEAEMKGNVSSKNDNFIIESLKLDAQGSVDVLTVVNKKAEVELKGSCNMVLKGKVTDIKKDIAKTSKYKRK